MNIGSLFHWVMGYERSVSGKRSYVSRIVFLRSLRLTERDFRADHEITSGGEDASDGHNHDRRGSGSG